MAEIPRTRWCKKGIELKFRIFDKWHNTMLYNVEPQYLTDGLEDYTYIPMQFVNKKDERGIDVYVDDIVGCFANETDDILYEHELRRVVYDRENGRYVLTANLNAEYSDDNDEDIPLKYIYRYRIMGNAWENKLLLNWNDDK